MGDGLTPPAGGSLNPTGLDEGRLDWTPSLPPGVIGLDVTGGGPAQTQGSMADRIVSFARQQRGRSVGDGQCFALADRALSSAGAKSAADYGRITRDADYVWGSEVALSDLRPGDVIQFRNYRLELEIVTEAPDATTTRTEEHTRPHHTAVVEEVGANGLVTVLEQNSPEGSPTSRARLYFTSGSFTSGRTTTTVRVRGTLWYYRPQAR
jgi:hypothetical protein